MLEPVSGNSPEHGEIGDANRVPEITAAGFEIPRSVVVALPLR